MEGKPNPINFAKGFASKLWEGLQNIGVNQDYPEVERDLQGNEIIELPTGERFNKELWESDGFQEKFFRNLREQSGQQGQATGQHINMMPPPSLPSRYNEVATPGQYDGMQNWVRKQAN